MVGLKRKFQNVIADPSPVSSSNPLHPNSLDRRMKAVRSCSHWNSALLHGRRSRGPQWDYATASYHVSKGSAEYYKGVTRIQSDVSDSTSSANLSSVLNHHGPTPLSSQFPAGLQPRTPINSQLSDRLPQQQQLHSFQHESDQFSNRFVRHSSQHSQTSSLGRSIANPTSTGPYSNHPTHLPHLGNQAGIPPQSFSNLSNPAIITSNVSESKSTIFTNQGPNMLNSSNVGSSPHFQPGLPSSANVGIARHMSTTPSLPTSQPEPKGEASLLHSGPFHNSALPPQPSIERPHSSQLVPTPQSFSPTPHSFDKTPTENLASPTHPQAVGSPAPHSLEPQIAVSNRKLHPTSNPSHHSFSHRPVTPGSAQTLAPTNGSANPVQVFQPMYVNYPSSGNGPALVSISSQARSAHYNLQQPNLNNLKPPTHQVLQSLMISQPSNESNQFQSQSPLSNNTHMINNLSHPSMMNNPNIVRSMPPSLPSSQYYAGMIPTNATSTSNATFTTSNQQTPG